MKIFSSLSSGLIIVSLFLFSCSVIDQASKVYNLVNCDFRIKSVDNINLAGVNVQYISNLKDLSWSDAAKLMKAVASPSFPLTFRLNFEARNPNPSAAGMNQMEYMVFIDDIQMASGSLNQSFTIPPNNGTTIIPMQIATDLKQVLKGKSLESIVNFGLNLSGAGNKPTRFMVKLKPTILINGKPMTYPGYITVRTEYSGN